MKKVMIIILVLAAITGQAQTKIEQLKAKRAEVLALKTSIDFENISPDSLIFKRPVLSIGRDQLYNTVFYLRVNNQNFKLSAFYATIVTVTGEQYHLIGRGDSIQCVPQNSNEAIFTISPK
jgi:hypothetical protein